VVSSAWVEVNGGVTAPAGFVAGGLYCGIRKVKKDIAIIRSDRPAAAAGVFTTNRTVAACVAVDRKQLAGSGTASAIVVNSGNANACTGHQGVTDTWTMVDTTARVLGIPREHVLVASTGVIGQYLPIDKIITGIEMLAGQLSADGHADAAEAIMTTDTYMKEAAVRLTLDGAAVTIGGMAKGSGMIAPNMATMLAFITTDASLSSYALQAALQRANGRSFNRITVDGDMSTNDMALVLANGAAGAAPITPGTPAFKVFCDALEAVMVKLAKMIARDGEGATKLVEIAVTGARTEAEAAQAAESVANSNLVKTAIHGADANWGRILAAVGYSGIDFDPDLVAISFNDLPILKPNYQIVIDEVKAKDVLQQENIVVQIDLAQGKAEAKFWTCDLSKEYVHINASYRS
jgi:glutamate N-acetyltransferase/amino-acid N-acetyltransferase